MIQTTKERQAPQKLEDTEVTHLARYMFANRKIKRKKMIIDAPCGSGYGTYLLSKKSKKTIGLDINRETIKHANEFFKTKRDEFIEEDIENFSKSIKGPIDYIISFEGIEHIKNPDKFLIECSKTLSKNGKLIISTPRKPHGNPFHTKEFSLTEFEDILKKYFKIEKIYGQIYTKIFDMQKRKENPESYKKFNFIAICSKK